MELNFKTAQAAQSWRAVNDGVMGGRSSGGPRFENGTMVFEGVINTNGGGFSSTRTALKPGGLAEADSLALRIKSDGRAYALNMQTNARYRFRPITFQAMLPATAPGEWAEISVPLNNLKTLVYGQPILGAKFDKSKVRELSLYLGDGKDGPFKLEVEWIRACT